MVNKKKIPNHLIKETSPYLLQHAYNPVEWFAWNDEAFQKAKNEDKPVLVSIGYAACHWCHVMEHESFEDENTAAFMNTYFVNIKIDREERPDIDHIYMNACQLITGAGGWPLNMFLTPELKPITGGTYFPPKPAYGKPSWMEVLIYVADIFKKERDKVEQQAKTLSEHILKMDAILIDAKIQLPQSEQVFSDHDITQVTNELKKHFDTIDGGFGSAPKFPSAMQLQFLMRTNYFKKDNDVEKQIHLTLQKMMRGGIYDHVAGGFARYSVDTKWFAPHFEKMLYDNALLVSVYAEAYMQTKNESYKNVIEQTLQFAEREMMHDAFAFYASFDADSEGEEGKYYTWTKKEIEEVLQNDAEFACRVYAVSENGNWEHSNILNRNHSPLLQAAIETSADEKNKLASVNKKLFEHRQTRIKPARDEKIILSWNALMASAFIMAYKATGNEKYKNIAEKNIQYVLANFNRKGGKYYHVLKDGVAKYEAMLDDYALFIKALLDYFEVSAEYFFLEHAIEINKYVLENFMDTDNFFFFSDKNQSDVPLRTKEFYDHATPCGNSTMVSDLIRLSVFTGDEKLKEHACKMIASLKQTIITHPSSFANWLNSIAAEVSGYLEVAITGNAAASVLKQIISEYYPFLLIMTDKNGENADFPLLRNRYIDNETFIYVCRNYACKMPVRTVSEYKLMLNAL